jgi:NAD(P)-dependent dehydrogenase (short-subunit alcohol dehydrogenase family)
MLLQNKNTVIYGGGGTVGGAVARAFAREGATVYLAGRSLAGLNLVAQEINAAGGKAKTAEVDAMDEADGDRHAGGVSATPWARPPGSEMTRRLEGKVALVAGATRGAGRAIAVELACAGALVYGTGRSVRGNPSSMGRPETIEETAELAQAAGGTIFAVRVDHTEPEQVEALVERVRREQGGRLDVLVNNIWGGDPLTEWGHRFWEHSLTNGLEMQRIAVTTHLITSWYLAPLMIERGSGLVVEITDGNRDDYRGNLYYDLVKASTIRLARSQAKDLVGTGVTALALTPGFLRSEAMLDHFGVTEATWHEAIAKDPHFAFSETPRYIGRAVASLAADPVVSRWSGQALSSWDLAHEYGFTDFDGSQPDWGRHYAEMLAGEAEDRSDAHA